jgi:hypothetical protein
MNVKFSWRSVISLRTDRQTHQYRLSLSDYEETARRTGKKLLKTRDFERSFGRTSEKTYDCRRAVQAMKTCGGGVEVHIHSFLTSALYFANGKPHALDYFIPGGKNFHHLCNTKLCGPPRGAGLHVLKKRENFIYPSGFEHRIVPAYTNVSVLTELCQLKLQLMAFRRIDWNGPIVPTVGYS